MESYKGNLFIIPTTYSKEKSRHSCENDSFLSFYDAIHSFTGSTSIQ